VWLDVPPEHPEAPRLPPAQRAQLAQGREVTWMDTSGEGALRTYVPLPGSRPAALELDEGLQAEHAYVQETLVSTVLASGAIALGGGLLAMLLGLFIVGRPLRRLAEHARRIGAGELSMRLPEGGKDEIAALGREMNRMAEQLEQGTGDGVIGHAQSDRAPRRMRDAPRHLLGGLEDEGERPRRAHFQQAVLAVVDPRIAGQHAQVPAKQRQVVLVVDAANAAEVLGRRLVVEMADECIAAVCRHGCDAAGVQDLRRLLQQAQLRVLRVDFEKLRHRLARSDARLQATATGMRPIRPCHSRGPVSWTLVPCESTATVTGMSLTSNS